MPCELLRHPSNRSVARATSGLRPELAPIPEKKLLLLSISIPKTLNMFFHEDWLTLSSYYLNWKTFIWRIEHHKSVLKRFNLGGVNTEDGELRLLKMVNPCEETFKKLKCWRGFINFAKHQGWILTKLTASQQFTTPWTQDVNWTYIRRPEDVQTSYVRST